MAGAVAFSAPVRKKLELYPEGVGSPKTFGLSPPWSPPLHPLFCQNEVSKTEISPRSGLAESRAKAGREKLGGTEKGRGRRGAREQMDSAGIKEVKFSKLWFL